MSTGNNKNKVLGNPKIRIKIRFFGRLKEGKCMAWPWKR